ncbi:MAG: DegV family protein, partial [Ruminococcus flavefaciens]|nr:DegV family protein [Ruminococcus flavefaciens]
MNYKIVVDSCCELPEKERHDRRFQIVPLGLEVGDYAIQDDETFDQKTFLQKVAACPTCPKSSCPSPEKYREAYHDEAEEVYVVTLSS